MPRKRKMDYSVDEMLELTRMDRKAFTDTLKRFCDLYKVDLTDFKVDETKPKSDYFFPPDIALPLAVMLKHLREYPLYRANADESKVTGTGIAAHEEALIEEVDRQLPPCFQLPVYRLRGRTTSQEIADWTEPFVRELTHFVYNLSTMEHQNVGIVLRKFTKKLNKMNECLYDGELVMCMAAEPAKIEGDNCGMDEILAEVIRGMLRLAAWMRESDFPELDELTHGRFSPEECEKMSKEEQRQRYYDFLMGDNDNEEELHRLKEEAEKRRKNRREWVPVEEEKQETELIGYHREIDRSEKELYEIVDRFVGQALVRRLADGLPDKP